MIWIYHIWLIEKIEFPFDDSETNNARIEITELAFEDYTFEDGEECESVAKYNAEGNYSHNEDSCYTKIDTNSYPTSIAGSITVDGVRYGNINATIAYTELEDGINISTITMNDAYLKPYNLDLSLASSDNIQTIQATALEGSDTIFTIAVTNTYEDETLDDGPHMINGTIVYDELRVEASININELSSEDSNDDDDDNEMTPRKFNDNINIELFETTSGDRIGKIIMKRSLRYEVPLFVEFEDGTKKHLLAYADSLYDLIMGFYDEHENILKEIL